MTHKHSCISVPLTGLFVQSATVHATKSIALVAGDHQALRTRCCSNVVSPGAVHAGSYTDRYQVARNHVPYSQMMVLARSHKQLQRLADQWRKLNFRDFIMAADPTDEDADEDIVEDADKVDHPVCLNVHGAHAKLLCKCRRHSLPTG